MFALFAAIFIADLTRAISKLSGTVVSPGPAQGHPLAAQKDSGRMKVGLGAESFGLLTMSRELANIPLECFRERVYASDLRTRWAAFPHMIDMLERFVTEMLPGDELWTFDYGSCTGLAVRRDGVAIQNELYIHALQTPPGPACG
jgi:hypothetical protein